MLRFSKREKSTEKNQRKMIKTKIKQTKKELKITTTT